MNPVAVALLVPIAGLLAALAYLLGGRSGQIAAIVSAVLFGLAIALALVAL